MNSMQIFFNLTKLKSIFLVLQKVHEQIIIHYGGNNFKVPHLRNDRELLANDDAYSTLC